MGFVNTVKPGLRGRCIHTPHESQYSLTKEK